MILYTEPFPQSIFLGSLDHPFQRSELWSNGKGEDMNTEGDPMTKGSILSASC